MVFLDSFTFMATHLQFLLAKTGQHVVISLSAIAVALLIALPAGTWLGHIHRGNFLAVSLSNLGRALPTLAVIAILIGVLGLGFRNVFTTLVIICIPPILTNTYLAIDQVEPDLVRAGRGMGLTETQLLLRIELPLGLPLMFAGIRTATIHVIGSATIGGVVGGGGLGDPILQEAAYGLAGVIAAAFWVAALAALADLILSGVQRAVTPRNLRTQKIQPAI
jgi:osmoprotectant transport system permease protein